MISAISRLLSLSETQRPPPVMEKVWRHEREKVRIGNPADGLSEQPAPRRMKKWRMKTGVEQQHPKSTLRQSFRSKTARSSRTDHQRIEGAWPFQRIRRSIVDCIDQVRIHR